MNTTFWKKTVTAAATGALVAGLALGAAHAEPGKQGMGKHHPGREFLQSLNLTDEQREQLKAVREQFKGQFQAVREQVQAGTLTREQAWEQMQALHEKVKAASAPYLTPEQQQQIEAHRAEMKEKRGEGFKGPGAGRGEVADAMNLTDEQKEQVKTVRAQYEGQFKAIRDQVKAGTLTKEQAKEKAQALMAEVKAAMAPYLTPEQLQQLEEMKARRQGRHGNKSDQ